MGEVLDVAKVLVSPIGKLIDVTSAGVGAIYEPHKKKKMADATAYEINTIAESLRNNCDVLTTYKDGKVAINTPEINDFLVRTNQRIISQELHRQYNIESVIENTYEELKNELTVSEEPVDKDWINRFFYCVGDVSNQEMQRLWGRILAGEIKQPSSFSKRTLEVVRNLTQQEASTFEKIIPLILYTDKGAFIYRDTDLIKKYNVSYSDIMLLDECGLIVLDGLLVLDVLINKNETESIYTPQHEIKIKNISNDDYDFQIKVNSLTRAGCELLKILNYFPNEEYINDVAKEILRENKEYIEVSVYNE